MSVFTSVAASVNAAAYDVLAAIPDPGQGAEPPGAAGLLTILGWAAWVVFALCVAGVLIVAGKMVIAHRRGEGAEASGGLALVLAGTILAGSAAALVGAVLV
jgi:hypothetical protein